MSPTRERRRAAGLCTECGKPTEGKARCATCLAVIRAQRAAKRAAGLCNCCHKRPVEPSENGPKTCAFCRKRSAERYAALKAAGKCTVRGCPRAPKPGRTRCKPCMDDAARRASARQKAYRAQGKCKCGREVEPGHLNCRRCLDSHRAAKKRMCEDRRAAGLCTLCGRREPAPGGATCYHCRWHVGNVASERRLRHVMTGEEAWRWYGELEAPPSVEADPTEGVLW